MPSLTVARIINGIPVDLVSPAHPKAFFLTESGTRYIIAFAPRETAASNYAGEWVEVARPGDFPLLMRSGKGLPKLSFDLVLLGNSFADSVQAEVDQLVNLAGSGERMTFSYGPQEAGFWQMTTCSVTSTERQEGTNLITEAIVSIELSRASSASIRISPLAPPPAIPIAVKLTVVNTQVDSRTRYTFKSGDTLWALAVKYYGNGSQWPKIADANGIRDPKKIAIGTVVVIP